MLSFHVSHPASFGLRADSSRNGGLNRDSFEWLPLEEWIRPDRLLAAAPATAGEISIAAAMPNVWINEFHYENTGADANEFIEVAGAAGTDLNGWQLLLYNGATGTVYDTINLSGTIPTQYGGDAFGMLSFALAGLQDTTAGIALFDGTNVIQFISYEGAFTATGGAASGMMSVDIGVSESDATSSTQSLGLAGSGDEASDFTWLTPRPSTAGAENRDQTLGTPLDLSAIGDDGFIIQGDAAGDGAGRNLASGDFNGDGFDDILVGAPANDDNGSNSGAAYLIFGTPDGLANIDLSTLNAADGLALTAGIDTAGRSTAMADINGDGFDDLLIVGTAYQYGFPYGIVSDALYVVYGNESGTAPADLDNMQADEGVRRSFNGLDDVAAAGDVNNDGFEDFLFSDPGSFPVRAYLVLGGTLAPALTGAIKIYDAIAIFASAGDINGDGFDDMIFGLPSEGTSGAAYVVFGSATPGQIDLSALGPTQGFKIDGDAGSGVGASVASAGDVNGDSFDDIIIGASSADIAGTNSGAAYVIFGKASGFANIDLATLAASDGFAIIGDLAFDQAGASVAAAGDVDGDGYDDIIIGAPNGDDGGYAAGEAYVIYGKASGFATIELGNLSSEDGYIIQGDAVGDFAGSAVSGGDINGDGFDEVLVGAPNGNDGGDNAGEAYVIFGKAKGLDLVGTADPDELHGGMGDDVIDGLGGDDLLFGEAGDDMLFGGGGNDRLDGGSGVDLLTGGAGNDSYVVDDAGDQLVENTGEGSDTVETGLSFTLAANFEKLTLTGTGAINGTGNSLGNVITGNGAANILTGNGGGDTLNGGGGADTLNGGTGIDTMAGGSGNDSYIVDNVADTAVEGAGAGTDLVQSSVSFMLGANVENLTLTAAGAINGTGNSLANMIIGNGAANVLTGQGGADHLSGGDGNDRLNGGGGADILTGGTGTDWALYASATAGVTVSLALLGDEQNTGGAGLDTLQQIENLGGSSFADTLTGNAGANVLEGGLGADMLNGGAGADIMRGGGGADTYVVGQAGDQAIEMSGQGTDRVDSSVSFTLGAHIENLILTGSSAINGTGNGLANVITGNGSANILSGGAGADTLNGGVGADGLNGGDGADTLSGNDGADILRGNAGNDIIGGGAGDDQVFGGAGHDHLTGSTGFDDFRFDAPLSAATNVDDILDYAPSFDTIFLDRDIFAAIALGTLAPGAFRAGTAAGDAGDRIIYEAATGRIWYDVDGTGAAAKILFARVDPGTALTNAEFVAYDDADAMTVATASGTSHAAFATFAASAFTSSDEGMIRFEAEPFIRLMPRAEAELIAIV